MKTRFLITFVIGIVGIFSLILFSQVSAESVSYADPIFEQCYDDDDCTIDMLYELSQNNSTQTVFRTIDELVDRYVEADFYCHPLAHHLGEFLYGYVNRDLRKASSLSDYRCASGIMHGLIENNIQIRNLLDGESIKQVDIEEPCRIVRESLGKEAQNECIHGMGHSIIKFYDYNTTQALERCNEFDDSNEIYMCNGGLFMQNIGEYVDVRGGDFNDADNYHPCNMINGTENDEAATLCYRYQANYFLIKTTYDLQNSYSLCKGIKDQRYIYICFKGVASHLTAIHFNDLDKTQLMCLSTPVEYQEACIIGAIESLTRLVSEQKAKEFCLRFDGHLYETCHNRMNSLLASRF